MEKMTCASFFAGVGGIDLGFEETGSFRTLYANEFDSGPAETFELNFPNVKVDRRDINNVPSDEIPDTDVILAGFPCQAFSVAGYRKGFGDDKGRGVLFFELVRIIQDKLKKEKDADKEKGKFKAPRVIFLENVKNLVGHDNGNTFRTICECLDDLGYKYTAQVLNAMNYGNVAQNRERIYIVAFRNQKDYERFRWPMSIPLTHTVRNIIDFGSNVGERYYYTPEKYKGDIYYQLRESMMDDDPNNPAIYQWRRRYVRKNKSGVVPTLTANQGEGGHNVCLIHTDDGRIRKMTPRECFNAQGFPKSFKLPEGQSDSKLYKQAGNSVCVSVIERIAEEIAKACE